MCLLQDRLMGWDQTGLSLLFVNRRDWMYYGAGMFFFNEGRCDRVKCLLSGRSGNIGVWQSRDVYDEISSITDNWLHQSIILANMWPVDVWTLFLKVNSSHHSLICAPYSLVDLTNPLKWWTFWVVKLGLNIVLFKNTSQFCASWMPVECLGIYVEFQSCWFGWL